MPRVTVNDVVHRIHSMRQWNDEPYSCTRAMDDSLGIFDPQRNEMSETTKTNLTRELAQQLGEAGKQSVYQLRQVVAALGDDVARELLAETLQIEAGEGMLTLDQSRRRTPGGVYFFLAKSKLTDEQRKAIWPKNWRLNKTPQTDAPPAPPIVQEPPLQWSERTTLYGQITEYGEVRTVKVTLIGRPGKVIERGDLVLTTMKSTKVPTLPRGLPTPPEKPTIYALYLSAKHWRKVKQSLSNPEDVLIVEGWQAYDPDLKGIAVWGTNVTTKLLQQQLREQQKQVEQ
jgi:hypothetical protein